MQSELDWIDQEAAREVAYRFWYGNDPEAREITGPIEVKFDPVTGREMRQRQGKVAVIRGAKADNMRDMTIYLDPVPHIRGVNPKPPQGWYSSKGDSSKPNQRDRPCLLPDALVDTPFGPRQIQHLQKGEIIYGYNEETQRRAQTVVEDIVSRRKDEYLEVELENGHVLKLTPEHLVFTKNRGWVEAQTLTPADDLLGINLWTERGDYIETLIGIYALVNLSNGKMYVGSAFKVADRAKRHFRCLKEGRHSNLHLQAAYNNGDRFSVLLLEKVEDKGKLIAREQYYIDHYHTMDKEFGYNLTPAGRTIITPEGRKRIGLSKKGKTIEELWGVERATQRRAELRSQVGENNPNWGNRGSLHPNYGKTTVERFGPEEAARLAGITSKTHKGRSKDKEHRRKISVAKTGVPLSEPHKAAIALGLADRPPPGPCKEITKQKIKVSLKKSYAEGRCPLTEAQIQARRRNARALHARRMEALHEN